MRKELTINISNTILIIGDSPFLTSIESKIGYLLYKYKSIGINHVIRKIRPSIHAFVDMDLLKVTNAIPNIPAISLASYGDLVMKKKELFETFSFNIEEDKDIIKNGKLAWCGFTHDFTISYAILKGYKNIILIGAADFIEGRHYSTNWDFKYSEVLRNNSKQFIEEICTKHANIYTCNPTSILNIPTISVDDLLR